MSDVLSVSSAMDAIRRRRTMRVHAAVAALTLLGMEDRFAARIEWKTRLQKVVTETERQALMSVRQELERRSVEEMTVAREEWKRRNKLWTYFPDEGPFRRELYPKHMEFVDATREYDEVLMLSANRCGKSQLGAICISCWTTGRYPHWWTGRTFEGPITAWICNKTAKDVRDINEAELLGPTGNEQERGTGFLPSHLIQRCTPKPGTPHAFEFITVEHVSGGSSYIVSKSYDQGREAYQGRKIEAGWGDEEIPREIWDEMRLRTMICNGVLMATYTPLNGLTEMTQWFMESAGLSLEEMRHGGALEGEVELEAAT